MQFKQLETFIEVVRNKSFTTAAENLFVSQPTVSNQVAELERSVGAKLLKRSTREVELTEVGREFLKYAEDILKRRDDLQELVDNFNRPEILHGSITIGASSAPAEYILPKIMADFSKLENNISFELIGADSREIAYKVLEEELEFGIVGSIYKRTGLKYTELMSDRLILIAPTNRDFLEAGQKIPLIRRELGSGTGRELEFFLKQESDLADRLQSIAIMPSNQAVVEAVAAGLGISLVSGIAAKEALESRRVQEIKLSATADEASRQFYLVDKTNRQKSAASEAFRDYLIKSIANLA